MGWVRSAPRAPGKSHLAWGAPCAAGKALPRVFVGTEGTCCSPVPASASSHGCRARGQHPSCGDRAGRPGTPSHRCRSLPSLFPALRWRLNWGWVFFCQPAASAAGKVPGGAGWSWGSRRGAAAPGCGDAHCGRCEAVARAMRSRGAGGPGSCHPHPACTPCPARGGPGAWRGCQPLPAAAGGAGTPPLVLLERGVGCFTSPRRGAGPDQAALVTQSYCNCGFPPSGFSCLAVSSFFFSPPPSPRGQQLTFWSCPSHPLSPRLICICHRVWQQPFTPTHFNVQLDLTISRVCARLKREVTIAGAPGCLRSGSMAAPWARRTGDDLNLPT